MGIKKIKNIKVDKALADTFKKDLGINDFFAEILVSKGFTNSKDALFFINQREELTPPETLIDMDRAVERIETAVENKEIICIYGDYDADGVCSTAIMLRYFRDMGVGVKAYIPKRQEGYGLNIPAINRLKKQNVGLIITVDNGIVSFDEVDYATSLGIDVIITDHHQAKSKVPNAVAVICPTRKDCPSTFKDLCGAGVAFKLIEGLEKVGYDILLEHYGDLLAIATVADIVPLTGENRSIVKTGLERLAMTDNIGLLALFKLLNLEGEIYSSDIAFKIGPRLNAAGRMGRATTALRLLITQDHEEAQSLAVELSEINNLRKATEKKIQIDVEDELSKTPTRLFDSVLVLAKKNWHHGVIGITASRIVSNYSKPTFLLEIDENGVAKGSGRGTEGLSLFKMLGESESILLKYGGHEMAAGLSIEEKNIEQLRENFNKYINKTCQTMPVDSVNIDKVAEPKELTVENIKLLNHLEPFGQKNEEISFLLKNYYLDGVTEIGSGKHIRCYLVKEGVGINVLFFGVTKEDFSYKIGDNLDIVSNASINDYNGNQSVSIVARYSRISGFNEDVYFKSRFLFDKIMRGDKVDRADASFVVPTRDEVAEVYRFLLREKTFLAGYELLSERVNPNYAKARFSIMALKERNLIFVKRTKKGDIIELVSNPEKTDIDSSEILVKLRTLI